MALNCFYFILLRVTKNFHCAKNCEKIETSPNKYKITNKSSENTVLPLKERLKRFPMSLGSFNKI
jgi:hypothetical protein